MILSLLAVYSPNVVTPSLSFLASLSVALAFGQSDTQLCNVALRPGNAGMARVTIAEVSLHQHSLLAPTTAPPWHDLLSSQA